MKVNNENGKLTVTVEGRLDAATAPALPEAVGREEFQELIVDLENLEYISSAGLRGLLQCQKMASAKNASMIVKKPTAAVYDVMKMSGFTKILDIRE